ncbi:CoA-disulfide reductase [Lactobacillus coryniformis subsp. torquens DSM = KCTC 3535] [Leuconostoc pseudomesenteroides]|nr:CoA-disulfide reductase [Lactobacillus coryniformis subsp. torquens DSM = KCTC 3535] [Leuconostoc pseudomesenteroides]
METADTLRNRFNIDIRVNSEVTHIDRENKIISVNHNSQLEKLHYDKLILSLGAKPIIPHITGMDTQPNIFQLRNIPDIDQIMANLSSDTKHVTVIGAGFIGMEVTENLVKRGISVSLVERSNHILPRLDIEMARFIENELRKNFVNICTNSTVIKIDNKMLYLNTGKSFANDAIIMAAGVHPSSEIAVSAGIKIDDNGGIMVDHRR